MSKPLLVVIEGGAIPDPAWLAVRQTVLGRAHFDRTLPVFFRLALHDVKKGLAARRRQPIFDLWSVVIGEPPPVNNVEYSGKPTLISLSQAHACFQGIRRPIGEDDDGDNVVAYILRPREHYVYRADMVTVAHLKPVPGDLAFVCYVRLDLPEQHDGVGTKGVITHWQFVDGEIGPGGDVLPVGYDQRYKKRLW